MFPDVSLTSVCSVAAGGLICASYNRDISSPIPSPRSIRLVQRGFKYALSYIAFTFAPLTLSSTIVWGFGLLLFGLALRHYFKGTRQIWLVPVTGVNWFASPPKPKRTASGRLPAPVTSRQRSVTKPSAAIMPSNSRRTTTEKPTTRPTHKRENSDAPVYYIYTDKSKQPQPSSAARRPSQDRGRDTVQRGDSSKSRTVQRGDSSRSRTVQRGDSSRSRTKQDADYWRRDVSPRR